MFAGGIDEVDWASMEHAYGPADDVPGLLRGLASADPAERERALDGMYGAVHHQATSIRARSPASRSSSSWSPIPRWWTGATWSSY